jgi:biopolymer transport protein ExbB
MNEHYSLMQYVDKGGLIGYILLVLCTIGLTFVFWKFIHIIFARVNRKAYCDEVLNETEEIKDSALAMKVAKTIIDEKMVSLESGLSTIRIIAAISPLLGLLGTVVGILDSFETISKTGLGDPSSFASGISLALVTTVMGLVIAIPHYIGYNYLVRNIDSLESVVLKELDLEILKRD